MWGSNEKDEKILIAVALNADANAVDIYSFPFESTSEEFYNLMLNEWRESHEVSFPEGYTHIVRPLTASDQILPDSLKADRPDIMHRAQTEWHFVVLSNKLYHSFLSELEEIKEKIKGSDIYKNHMWEDMKQAWERIQKNIFDKTLLREHGQQLRDMTNDIFTQLKNMRKEMDSEIDRVSRQFADGFNKKLDAIEEKIKSGLGLQPLFNDLKQLQQEFKDAELSRNDRSKIWKRIDVAFKTVKEKKFGEKSAKDTSALDRLQRRYEGLLSAIEKMEKSIRRDDKDKSFQDDRIANTEGQLEAQIRMAKLKMIDERINSKREKLAEMEKTKVDLEEKINREKKYLEEQRKQQVLKDELKEAKENVKQKIADNINAQADHVDADALEKAAEAIANEKARKTKPKEKETILGAIGETLGESLEDVGDSLGAIASVVGERIEDAFKDLKEDTGEVVKKVKDEIKGSLENVKSKMKKEDTPKKEEQTEETAGQEGSSFSGITDKIEHAFKDLKEEAGEVLKDVSEGVKETIADVKHKLKKEDDHLQTASGESAGKEESAFAKMTDKVEEAFKDLKEEADEVIKEVKEKVKDTVEDIKDKFKKEDKGTDTSDTSAEAKTESAFSDVTNKLEDVFQDLKEEAGDFFEKVKDEVKEAVEDAKEKLKKSKEKPHDGEGETGEGTTKNEPPQTE